MNSKNPFSDPKVIMALVGVAIALLAFYGIKIGPWVGG